MALRSRSFEISAEEDPIEICFERGLTDGLPVVPPTEERVEGMLSGTRRSPGEIIGFVSPNNRPATVEKIAINAVMAGCRPEYMPVIIAGVEAMCDEQFNLHGVQATTHFASPLFILNGSLRRELHVNCGHNVFGQGWRANATIGRALRLIMVNIGGAKPGDINKSTLGHPGKYTYCVGENEEENPWEPFHVERGYHREQSTITVFAAEGPVGISDHYSRTAEELVTSLGKSMVGLWNHKVFPLFCQTVLVLCPEHAKTIAQDGWTKRDVRQCLYEKVRRPLKELKPGTDGREVNPLIYGIEGDETPVPKFLSPDHIFIIVAGGTAGRFSAAIPGWVSSPIGSEMVTRPITT